MRCDWEEIVVRCVENRNDEKTKSINNNNNNGNNCNNSNINNNNNNGYPSSLGGHGNHHPGAQLQHTV